MAARSPGWTAGSRRGRPVSTADDLVVWTKALVDGDLLDPDRHARRLALIQPIDPAQTRRRRLRLRDAPGELVLRHAGQIWGYGSQLIRDPDTDTTIVTLAALSVTPDGKGPASELSHAVRAQLPET